jgi:hypothetical protein
MTKSQQPTLPLDCMREYLPLVVVVADSYYSRGGTSLALRELVSLRVFLPTASPTWINDFVHHGGLQVLQLILHQAIKKEGEQTQILIEITRILRQLLGSDASFFFLNGHTEPVSSPFQLGVQAVFDHPGLVISLVSALRTPNLKIRCQITDLLAAVCVIAFDGSKLLLDSLSDSRDIFDEQLRFEWLIQSLLEDGGADLWLWRANFTILINTLMGSIDALESRCELRAELRRRGFEEVIRVRHQS